MKKMSFKKYTISLLVCFFALIGAVKGAPIENNDLGLVYNQEFSIGGSNYRNMSCSSNDPRLTIRQGSSDGESIITYNNKNGSLDTARVLCHWDGKVGVGENPNPGDYIYNFKMYDSEPTGGNGNWQPVGSVVIQISTESNYEVTADVIQYLGNYNIKKYEFVSGNEYVSFVNGCSGAECKVTPSQSVKNMTGNVEVTGKFNVFYDLDGKEVSTMVIVNIKSINATKIFPGNYGTCNIGSEWDGSGRYNNSSFYTSKTPNPTLPNCNSDNTQGLVEFKGWSKVNLDQMTVTSSDRCMNVVPAGSRAENNGTYMACYETMPNIIVSFSRGSLNAGGGWNPVNNSDYTYSYTGSSGSSVTLPDLSGVEGFKGWRKGTSSGQLFEAGASVPLDGSRYYAEIERTIVIRDYNKVVRKGKTAGLVVNGMTSCSASGTGNVTATYTGGECQVKGLEEGEGAVILVTTSDGQTVSFNYTVLPELSRGEDAEYFEINADDNLKYGENYHGQDGSTAGNSDMLSSGICPSYQIAWGGQTSDSSYFFGDGSIKSSGYKVQPCGGNNFYAYCLDPGLHGPDDGGWHTYIPQEKDLDNAPTLKGLVAYLIETDPSVLDIVNENNNPKKMAVHHATRVAAMIDGVDGGKGAFPTRYNYYKNTATAVAPLLKQEGVTVAQVKEVILDKFVNETRRGWSGINSVAEQMANYLVNSRSKAADAGDVQKTVDDTEVTTEGNTIKNVVKGTLKLPASAENVKLEPCGANEFEVTCLPATITEGTDSEGNKIYNYEVTLTRPVTALKLPKTTAEKKTMSYKLTYSGSGVEKVFLATSQTHSNAWQRMLVFNLGDAAMYAYFPFDVDCEALINSGTIDFNSEVETEATKQFVEAGCCTYLHDEATYGNFLETMCAQKCTTSTMNQVCSYSATAGKVDVYKVKEGYKGETPNIGTCVVNVADNKRENASANFTTVDDVGNKRNTKEFESTKNKYCEVTCREDWTISMEAYGNFLGKNAVAAGTYFKTQTDNIFIGTKRECYTSYIDYKGFTEEITTESQKVVDSYNKYSKYSHVYTDIKKQKDAGDTSNTGGNGSGICLYIPTCEEAFGEGWTKDGKDCKYDLRQDDPELECEGDDCYDVDTPDCQDYGQLNNYTLKTEGDIDSGTHDKFYNTKIDHQTTADNLQVTDKKLNGGSQMKTVYSGNATISCEATAAEEPGDYASGLSCSYSDDSGLGGSTVEMICTEYSDVVSGFCVENDTLNKEDALDKMGELMTSNFDKQANTEKNNVITYTSKVYDLDQQFYACQHIQLHNNSTIESNQTNNEIMNEPQYVLGKTVDYTKIESRFEPSASYVYDDKAYMTILGKDNVIEQFKEANEKVMPNYNGVSNEKEEVEITNVNTGDGGVTTEKVNLARNYLETTYYHTDKIWKEGNVSDDVIAKYDNGKNILYDKGKITENGEVSKEGKIVLCTIGNDTLNGTEIRLSEEHNPIQAGDNSWQGGSCFEVYMKYEAVNYVKTSIENSSFYKNKGDWYFSNSNGLFVAHGDSQSDAVSKSKNLGGSMGNLKSDPAYWFVPALVNVFPVSYSTPRNIYTYTYYFGDMGYYMENNNLGRIMGGRKPVIQENQRTCFYEVYEEACICCGSETYDYTYDEEIVENAMSSEGSKSPYQPSNKDKFADKNTGSLSIVPSTVQLGDLNSDSNRDMASNWGSESKFLYDGVLYNTDKGAKLIKEIESKGESIYVPNQHDSKSGLEYAYILNPEDIASIREYNDQFGYGISINRLNVVGRYLNGGSKSEVSSEIDLNTEESAKTISFVHYGSTFLERDLSAETLTALYQGGNNKVCQVEPGDLTGDGELTAMMHSQNCRWIDYVLPASGEETVGNNFYDGIINKPEYLRMAFK